MKQLEKDIRELEERIFKLEAIIVKLQERERLRMSPLQAYRHAKYIDEVQNPAILREKQEWERKQREHGW